jgi:hypothetical protein
VTVIPKQVLETVLAKHMAAAVAELAAIMENKIDERVVDRVAFCASRLSGGKTTKLSTATSGASDA